MGVGGSVEEVEQAGGGVDGDHSVGERHHEGDRHEMTGVELDDVVRRVGDHRDTGAVLHSGGIDQSGADEIVNPERLIVVYRSCREDSAGEQFGGVAVAHPLELDHPLALRLRAG